jgi:hypothetical protein
VNWQWLLAGGVAALLTVFDLDRTFYLPAATHRKVRLYSWLVFFVLANAGIAISLYIGLGNTEPFKNMGPVVRSLAIGLGFLAVIRAKFTTFKVKNQEIPFGFELLYEAGKGFVYKRINRIAKDARYDETTDMAGKNSLADLTRRARLSIDQDALLSQDDRNTAKAWLLDVLKDQATDEEEKRLVLANFILSGQRS